MHFFRVTVREHASTSRQKSETYQGRYSVIIKGVSCGIPLSVELWADPWKGNSPCFSWKDPFYFGRKYKDEFEYNFYQKKLNEGSYSAALGRGFEDLAEAKQFAESWKEKISKEHAEIIDGEKVLYNLLFR